MWASYPDFQLCLVSALIYPEAIVASFLYLVGYGARGGAIVVVFVSSLSMHKTEAGTRQSCMARQQRSQSRSSQGFFVQLCEKLNMLPVRAVTTVAPHCIAGQDC